MFLKDTITEYIYDCRIRKLSPRTVDNYTKQLGYFSKYLEDNYAVTLGEGVIIVSPDRVNTHYCGRLMKIRNEHRSAMYFNRYRTLFQHIKDDPQ